MVVIAGIVFLYPEAQSVITRIFFLWIILSVIWVFAYIYFRASNDPLPKDTSDASLIAYQKHQIQREIEVGSHVHFWYLFPLFAGATGVYFSFGERGLLGYSIFAVIFAIIWWINIRAVKQLRKDLKDLQK